MIHSRILLIVGFVAWLYFRPGFVVADYEVMTSTFPAKSLGDLPG